MSKTEGGEMSLVYLLIDDSGDCQGVFSTCSKALDKGEKLTKLGIIEYFSIHKKEIQ